MKNSWWYQEGRLYPFDPFLIKTRLHVRRNLMRCYSCGGLNNHYVKTGFWLGWAVSNTCGACLKAQADMTAKCEICEETKPRGNSHFYKFPDCGPGGMDMDGWCCDICGKDAFAAAQKHWWGSK